jgi:hypothetical protein
MAADKGKSKEEAAALRAQLNAAKIAALEAKTAQDALAVSAKVAAAQQAAAAKEAANSLKAQAKAAQDAAKAQVAGMAAINRVLNEKHVADARAAALESQAKKNQAAAALATQKVADAQAKAAAKAKEHGTAAKNAMGGASDASNAHDKILSKKKALLQGLGGDYATLANAVEQTGGPLGEMASKLKSVVSIAQQAAQAGPIGIAVLVVAALAAALAVAAAAAVAAAIAMTKFALSCADAARSQRLLDNAAAGSVARGSELNKVVSDIASRVPIAREQVAEFARQLQLAGINGLRLQTAVTAIAMIESVIPGAGAKIEGLVERFQRLKRAVLTKADLEGTGLALADVAAQLAKSMNITQAAALQMLQNGTASTDKVLDAMRKAIEQKFGKTIAAQMMSLSVQFDKLKENIAALFSGLDLEPLLAGLKSITDLFSQNTVTGRVLKEIMTGVFQKVFDSIAAVAPMVRSFFLGAMIYALKFYLAIRPIASAIMKFAQTESFLTGLKVALVLLAVPFVVIGAVIAGVITVVGMLAAAFGAVVAGITFAVGWIVGLVSKAAAAFNGLQQTGFQAAMGLASGIISGLGSIIGAVMGAVANVGSAIEQALRDAIGWHSPATLGIDAIGAIGDGMGAGAPAASEKADKAVGGLVSPNAARAAAKGVKASGGAKIFYFEIHAGAEGIATEIRKALRIEGETALVGSD